MLRVVRRLGRRSRKFLKRVIGRARFIASIRSSDVFVIAYPKSGTNWVGFFLASVIADRKYGTRHDLTLSNMSEWVPGASEAYLRGKPLPPVRGGQTPRIYKIHAPSHFWFRRVVCLVRDPRDVMVSYYYHQRRSKADFHLSMDEFVERNEVFPGDWGEHVRGWLRRTPRDGVLLVRYEDLHREPETWFRRIASACGIDLTDAELRHYLERSSFRSMSQAEEAANPENVRDINFVRRGVVGDWREELSEASSRLIERRYGDLMEALGYPHGREVEDRAALEATPAATTAQDAAGKTKPAPARGATAEETRE